MIPGRRPVAPLPPLERVPGVVPPIYFVSDHPKRQFKGIWIPADIWLSNDLSIGEKVLLAEIDSLEDSEKGFFASNAYLSKFFGLTERRIQSVLAALSERKYITIEHRNNRRIIRTVKMGGEENFTPTMKKTSPHGMKKTSPIYHSLDNTVDNSIVTPEDGRDDSPAQNRGDYSHRSYGKQFEQFWSLYPSRKNNPKKGAYKAFVARVREGVEIDELLKAAKNYARERKGEPDNFTLMAQTFLGPNERWLDYLKDEVPEKEKPNAGKTQSQIEAEEAAEYKRKMDAFLEEKERERRGA